MVLKGEGFVVKMFMGFGIILCRRRRKTEEALFLREKEGMNELFSYYYCY